MKEINFSELAHFTPRQLDFASTVLDPSSKYTLYGGSKGSGKSYALRWMLVYLLLDWAAKGHKNVRVALFCEDYPALKDRQLTKVQTEFPSWLGTLGDNKIEGLSFILKPEYGGGVLGFRNLDDPAKYNSSEFAAIGVDELTLNPEPTFQALRGIMRWPGIEQTKFIAGTNPIGIGMAWVKKYWITREFPQNEVEGDKFVFVPAKAKDNPHLGPEFEMQLAGLNPDLRKAYLEGSWDIYEGQMFTEFNEETHTCDAFPIPSHWKKYRSIDHGRTSPTSCHWYAVDELGDVWVYREYYQAATDADINARNIQGLSVPDEADGRYWFTTLDSACWAKHGGETIAEIYERNGVIAEPSVKGRVHGWSLVHEYLRYRTPESVYRAERRLKPDDALPEGTAQDKGFVVHAPKIHIFKECTNLVRELKDAIIEVKRDGSQTEDMDARSSDHALDDLSYGLQHMHEGRTLKKRSYIEELLMRRQKKNALTANNLSRYYANRRS